MKLEYSSRNVDLIKIYVSINLNCSQLFMELLRSKSICIYFTSLLVNQMFGSFSTTQLRIFVTFPLLNFIYLSCSINFDDDNLIHKFFLIFIKSSFAGQPDEDPLPNEDDSVSANNSNDGQSNNDLVTIHVTNEMGQTKAHLSNGSVKSKPEMNRELILLFFYSVTKLRPKTMTSLTCTLI